ncbi:MAG: YggS family pyridoxal phosphate-dependent enzyme [Coriobacteriaceae bacterium]|jgi:pyridoxal phosphate enzyme (YggS family)|nr:YggS family pyridoxal phosphate-dependent enzyme [Coriobacteriaceae bacterium]
MDLGLRYQRVTAEVKAVCQRLRRDPQEVRVIAVSKTVGPPLIEAAIGAGFRDFGENRPEALFARQAQFPQVAWHFIGNVQSRRIPGIVSAATLIHSLYQSRHLAAVEKAASGLGKVQGLLIEVNVSGEASKGGVAPDDLNALFEEALRCPHIQVRGLMTMAPQGDSARARECFKETASLLADLRKRFPQYGGLQGLRELSMGMSEDWREALVEGATMIRIGRAVFDDGFEGR